ncbi:MAG: adenylyl-sulfate kinase [Solirubrobacteraceae bacterium]
MTRPERRQSDGVVWQREALDRERREELLGQRGATVWFTGLPASGKSTIAAGLVVALAERGVNAYRLDGDNLRHGLCGDLGFDHASREENIRRAAEVARLMADAGLVTVVSLVSPYVADRAAARCLHADAGLPFVEVWVSTPLNECERRDPKGLYARARRGEVANMTGVADPYEPPTAPEIEIDLATSADAGVARVLEALATRGVV